MHLEQLAMQLIVIVGVALLMVTILGYFRVPTIVGFIVSGLLMGNFGIAESFPGTSEINEIGLALLMFTVGLEFSADKIRHLSRSMLGLGLGMVMGVGGLMGLISWASGLWNWRLALMIGMVTSLSSSAIIMKLLQKRRELETPHGNASVGILLAQDIVFAPMIMAIPFVFGDFSSSDQTLSYDSLRALLQFLGYCLGLGLFTRYLLNPLFLWVLKARSHELFFFLLFFLFSLIAFGTHHFIGSFSLGAFIAGLCFANSALAKQALSDILPLRDTFLGLLFTSVGMLVDLSFLAQNIAWILLGVALLLVVKPLVVYVLGRFQHYSHSVSLTAGLLTFQVGEFSIVLIKELDKRKYFSENDVQYFLALTVLTMALTPFVARLSPWLVRNTAFMENWKLWSLGGSTTSAQQKQCNAEGPKLGDHSIIIGYGVAGCKIGEVFQSLGLQFVAIEMNYNTVMKAQESDLPVIFGDAQRQEILHSAAIEEAHSMIITIPSVVIAHNIAVAARQMRSDLSIIVRVEYQRAMASFHGMEDLTLVVAEHESSLRLLSQSLALHGISKEVIFDQFRELRQSWTTEGAEDPWMDFFPHVHPNDVKFYKMKEHSYGAGLTLKALHIQEHTGAWVLGIQKEEGTPFLPDSEYILMPDDMLLLYASAQDFKRAHLFLEQGPKALTTQPSS